MSKYEQQFDSVNCICPYCGSSYQVEAEDYSESLREEQCEDCGKTYRTWQSFSVEHHSLPDCSLNGEEHQFEIVEPWRILGRKVMYRCEICDKYVLKDLLGREVTK